MVTPRKSPLDTKGYRLIELQNGLKALLITSCNLAFGRDDDLNDGAEEPPRKKRCPCEPSSSSKCGKKSQKRKTCKKKSSANASAIENCTSRTEEFDQENTVGLGEEFERIMGSSYLEKILYMSNSSINPWFSPEDDENEEGKFQELYPELTEKQKLRLCRDARKYDMMACISLCVGAGYFDDPKHTPGTAHLLEHLFLMGCEKYPDGTFFDDFLNFTGGSPWNGNTDGCRTVYYFDTSADYLKEALDILASHLKAPLLQPAYIKKELENVDGEFRKAIPIHNFRFNHFLQSLSSPEHPYNTFSWGNTETLTRNKSDVQLSAELKAFYIRYYSADSMYLTVQAALTLQELECMVTALFSEVPIRRVSRVPLRKLPMPFKNPRFTKLYRVKAMGDVRKLMVTWQLPAEAWKEYDVKPLDYIAYVLLNEHCNGLACYLRSRELITEMFTNPTETNMERSDACTLFGVHFTLTQHGLKNYEEVLLALFSFLKKMLKDGPEFQLFSELSKIKAMEFHYIREADDGIRIKELSEGMRIYEPEDILSGPVLMRRYDPELIARVQSHLLPHTANYMLFSHHFNSSNCKKKMKKEPYFGIEYTEEEINAEFMETLKLVQVYRFFTYPEPNPYVTTKFCVVKPVCPDDVERLFPTELYLENYPWEEQPVHLWFFQEGNPVAPQCNYTITFSSPVSLDTPESAATLDIITLLLQDQFKGHIYSASNANLEVSIQRTLQGLQFRLAGFNQKLTLLLKELLLTFARLEENVSEEQLADARGRIREEYENLMLEPCLLASDTRQLILIDRMWGVTCQYAVCGEDISLAKLKELAKKFKEKLHVRAYAAGNINRDGAAEIMNWIATILPYQPLSMDDFPKTRVSQLPLGEKCVRLRSFNLQGDTSVIKNIYQAGPLSTKTKVICDYITETIAEPMFNVLRTEKQLSYNPELIYHDEFGVMQLQVNLITQADKFGPDFINAEIDRFLEKFYETEISTLTEAKMNSLRAEMIASKQIHIVTPCDCEEVWERVVTQDVDFYFLQHEIEVWKTLCSKDIKDFFKRYLLRPSYVARCYPDFFQSENNQGWEFRKLSIQIIGYNAQQRRTKAQSEADQDYSQLKYLFGDQKKYFIEDISAFKDSLCAYPGRF